MIKYFWSTKKTPYQIYKVSVKKLHHVFTTDLECYEVLSPKEIRETISPIWSWALTNSIEEAKASLRKALVESNVRAIQKKEPILSDEEIDKLVSEAIINEGVK